MELRKYRKDNYILISPIYKKDETLFIHCAGGFSAILTKNFNKDVVPMFKAHGIWGWSIVDETYKEKRKKRRI